MVADTGEKQTKKMLGAAIPTIMQVEPSNGDHFADRSCLLGSQEKSFMPRLIRNSVRYQTWGEVIFSKQIMKTMSSISPTI